MFCQTLISVAKKQKLTWGGWMNLFGGGGGVGIAHKYLILKVRGIQPVHPQLNLLFQISLLCVL